MKFLLKAALVLFVVVFSASSCKNKEVSEDVRSYCDCLAQYQHNPEGRATCLDMMEDIKSKYAGDNRALMQILEETDGCL